MTPRSITPTRLVVPLLAADVVGGAGVTYLGGAPAHAVITPPAAAAPGPRATLPDVAQIAQQHGSAVVSISVSGRQRAGGDEDNAASRRGMPRVDPSDPFDQFFRRFGARRDGMGPVGGAPGLALQPLPPQDRQGRATCCWRSTGRWRRCAPAWRRPASRWHC